MTITRVRCSVYFSLLTFYTRSELIACLSSHYLSAQAQGEPAGCAGEGGEGGGGGVGGGGRGVPVQQEPPITERTVLSVLQTRVQFVLSSEN